MSKGDGMSYPGVGDDKPQRLGDEKNLQDPKYDNLVAPDWRRGMGPKQAEGKPGYDLTGKHPKNLGGK